MKKSITFLVVPMIALFSQLALALDPVYTAFLSDKAIKGYDTVAYFTENKPVKGSEQYSVEHQGAVWLFSSAENLELFKNDPEKYAPQYGGYCAYAVSQNQTASIKPELFTIHEGKLYLNYSESVNKKWLKQKQDHIKAADQNWLKLLAE